MLGGEDRPNIHLSGLLPEYEALESAKLVAISDTQVRKWRNPKCRTVENLISVITDKALNKLSRSDAVTFRRWWQDRIAAEDLDIGTANKDIGHIARMLHDVDMAH